MTSGALIRLEGFTSVTVTNRTVWTFADFVSADGARTTVEITAGDSVMDVARDLDAMVARIGERDIESEDEIESMLGLSIDQLGANRVIATAVSGLRSAVVQLQAHSNGVSLTEALGGQTIESVPLYANINRGLFGTDRTPNAFCLMAERAREAGFTTFKCAPFDEVSPPSSPDRILSEAKTGLERVAAVRRAIGPEAGLLVDCHSRFQRNTAPLIADELAKLGVSWFEEPVQPTSAIDELVEIADEISVPVAGGETGYGADFFDELVASRAAAVVMPDIKYCGGVGEATKSGRRTISAGGGFSLHSPSGPISLLASGHVSAAVAGAMPLEHAVYESDWRADLLVPAEIVRDGRLWIPIGAGLGATLNRDLTSRFGRTWKP
jgi:galactonate dehydratase